MPHQAPQPASPPPPLRKKKSLSPDPSPNGEGSKKYCLLVIYSNGDKGR